ncbi:MAG: XRE family transcriptional regulator [Deltaproteobacteria bacterium]|nr:XRE family transcriptional regulator [Deltaproteobacteria bacterium]
MITLVMVNKLIYITATMQGKELKRIRGLLKMTQRELSEALDLAKDTVARMERDKMPIQRVTEFALKYLLLMAKKRREKR